LTLDHKGKNYSSPFSIERRGVAGRQEKVARNHKAGEGHFSFVNRTRGRRIRRRMRRSISVLLHDRESLLLIIVPLSLFIDEKGPSTKEDRATFPL
jgi:hypothetical protein